jgi:hypothetical protein
MRTLRALLLGLPLCVGACGSEQQDGRGGADLPGADDSGDGQDDGGDGDGEDGGGTGGGDDGEGDGGDGGDDGEGDGDGTRFDVGTPDAGTPDTGSEFSYIWIANTHEGTVSKVDTRTLTEEGRYVTRPDGAGDPSRTSVNLEGDVAVLLRAGGVTKILADTTECEDNNGIPGIQTATDGTPLPWGEDECVAWHTSLTYSSQRAVAWTAAGNVWVTGYDDNSDHVDVLLLDGEDGSAMATIFVPVSPVTGFWTTKQAYGGAVDADDNLWWTDAFADGAGDKILVRVDAQTHAVTTWPKPRSTYGMTVDQNSRVWACGGYGEHLLRFDPVTETWDETDFSDAPAVATPGHTGCMADVEGRLWFGALLTGEEPALAAIDIETFAAVAVYPLPDLNEYLPRGISIDVDGYVWGVGYAFSTSDYLSGLGSNAYRFDPDTGASDVFSELSGAYTYSDMTGYALAAVQPAG